MKTVVMLTGVACLVASIFNASNPKPRTDAEKLEWAVEMTEEAVNILDAKGNLAKSDMRQLQKLVKSYAALPRYQTLKERVNPDSYPSLLLLTTVERATKLYFPSLGHSCQKECTDQIRVLFSQLGANIKTIEPNTSGRDILIAAVAIFTAAILFVIKFFRDVILLNKLKERIDKEKSPP